jgi:hypothetical protein
MTLHLWRLASRDVEHRQIIAWADLKTSARGNGRRFLNNFGISHSPREKGWDSLHCAQRHIVSLLEQHCISMRMTSSRFGRDCQNELLERQNAELSFSCEQDLSPHSCSEMNMGVDQTKLIACSRKEGFVAFKVIQNKRWAFRLVYASRHHLSTEWPHFVSLLISLLSEFVGCIISLSLVAGAHGWRSERLSDVME